MPDRYAEAVRARRAELRAQKALLDGAHRAELRACLALARVSGSAALAADLAALAREVRGHVDRADRRGRARLPWLVAEAARELAAAARQRREPVLAAVRALAGRRGLLPDPAWAALSAVPPEPVPLPPPDPAAAGASLLAALADGPGLWRLVLPVAGLPVLGLPALGAPALLPAALVTGAAVLVAAVHVRRTAADRARWRVWSGEVLAALRVGLAADLDAWLLALECAVAPELDRRAERRCRALDAELAALAADRAEVSGASG
jgi:hypothetical protein